MTYTVNGGALLPKRFKLDTTSPTVILDASKSSSLLLSIMAVEHAGATPTLTLEIYDTKTATSYYIQNAVAMTAKQRLLIDILDPLKVGEQLRATASAANQIDIHVTYSPRDATSLGGASFVPNSHR